MNKKTCCFKTIRVFKLPKHYLGTISFASDIWFGLFPYAAEKEVTRGHYFATFDCLNSLLVDLSLSS